MRMDVTLKEQDPHISPAQTQATGQHFNLPRHSLDNMKVSVIETINNKSEFGTSVTSLKRIFIFVTTVWWKYWHNIKIYNNYKPECRKHREWETLQTFKNQTQVGKDSVFKVTAWDDWKLPHVNHLHWHKEIQKLITYKSK